MIEIGCRLCVDSSRPPYITRRDRVDTRWRFVRTMRGLALLLVVCSACSGKPDEASTVLALINGREITSGEFDLRWSQLPEFALKTYAGLNGRRKFLDELITRELLLQEARKRGFDRDRALVEHVERFKERILLDQLIREEVDARITVTPEDMQAYYAANPGNFGASLSFEDAQDQVKEQLQVEKKRQRFDELVASLRAKAKLRVADVPIPIEDVPAVPPMSGAP